MKIKLHNLAIQFKSHRNHSYDHMNDFSIYNPFPKRFTIQKTQSINNEYRFQPLKPNSFFVKTTTNGITWEIFHHLTDYESGEKYVGVLR